jgi:hypothetical protein
MQMSKLFYIQGQVCEHIGHVLLSIDVSEAQIFGLDTFTEEMVFDVDMFDPGV